MKANIQAILSDCIEKGIMNYMKSMDIMDAATLQTLESLIWLEIDSCFTFEENDQ